MDAITLYAHTEIDAFVAWLTDYLRENHRHQLSRTTTLQFSHLPRITRLSSAKCTVVFGDSVLLTQPPARNLQGRPLSNDAVIFDLLQVQIDRLKVTASCHDDVIDYLVTLLRAAVKDFPEVVPDLRRAGVIEDVPTEPTQAERPKSHDEDAPKIGAPKLTELDDAQAEGKKEKLREYLRLILRTRDPQGKDVAAGMVGPARTTLNRYRRAWPEIEAEIKREIEAQKVRKV